MEFIALIVLYVLTMAVFVWELRANRKERIQLTDRIQARDFPEFKALERKEPPKAQPIKKQKDELQQL